MNHKERIPAKATRPEEQSDAIVVSFGSEWHEHLIAKRFGVVIRKRVPKSADFKWLYFHINNPVSAICARAPIEKIFSAKTKEVVALAKKINLTPAEILAYIGNDTSMGCYQLGVIQIATKPATSAALSEQLAYFPPQSFLIISTEAKVIIDQVAGFSTTKVRRSGKKSKQ
ncbi:MAG: hypothetical protein WCS94_12325 [Verrucomicrobiota bacterium]